MFRYRYYIYCNLRIEIYHRICDFSGPCLALYIQKHYLITIKCELRFLRFLTIMIVNTVQIQVVNQMEENMTDNQNLSFEDALAELEKIVQQLEGNSDSLADSVALFKRGRSLAETCQTMLDKAELQITKLNQAEDGSQTLEPLDVDISES